MQPHIGSWKLVSIRTNRLRKYQKTWYDLFTNKVGNSAKMSKKILPINLASFNKIKIREWIDSFEVILTDCDGEFVKDDSYRLRSEWSLQFELPMTLYCFISCYQNWKLYSFSLLLSLSRWSAYFVDLYTKLLIVWMFTLTCFKIPFILFSNQVFFGCTTMY